MTTGDHHAKLLIVDDEPLNIEMLGEILGDDYDIVFATNGEDALRLSSSEQPDLILLDVVMPGMDGHAVCRRLKGDAHTHDIPVIFVTALSNEGDETCGLDLGAIDYITKPVRAQIVRARVRNHIELKRSQDLLKSLSRRDGLTGLANRRAFDSRFEQEWHRAQRNGTPLGLIMIDIDHFKTFNDTYGHLPGDDCLKRVASALAGAVERPADMVARYGGEEFACILPETDASGIAEVGEHLRAAVYDLAIPHAQSSVCDIVTVSLGGVCRSPTPGDRYQDLITAADGMLYEAKENGRNRGVFGERGVA